MHFQSKACNKALFGLHVEVLIISSNYGAASSALLNNVTKEHLAQPIKNHMRSLAKPLQESMFSPALAGGWLHQKI